MDDEEDWDAALLVMFKAACDVAEAVFLGSLLSRSQDEERVGCCAHNGHPDNQGQKEARLRW